MESLELSAGQDRAIEALFEKHLEWADRVARKVWRGLPPSFDLDDLEQEARIEHWRQVPLYDPARGLPYQAFAYRAVYGAVQMACRRRHYRDNTHAPLSLRQIDARLRPDEMLLAREERRNCSGPREWRRMSKVLRCIAALPPEEANLVRRVYLEGVELKTIETELGIRLGQRLGAAIQRLQRALARSGRPAVTVRRPRESKTAQVVGECA